MVFPITLMSFERAWIDLFSPQLWVGQTDLINLQEGKFKPAVLHLKIDLVSHPAHRSTFGLIYTSMNDLYLSEFIWRHKFRGSALHKIYTPNST